MSGTNPGSTSSPFNQLLEVMARHKASDLFISVGSPVQMKINGNMVAVTAADKRLMPQQAEALLRSAINDQQWKRFQEENELNIGYGVKDVGSFRISLFRQRGTAAAVVRYIPGDIPEFDTLGMPPVLKELILQPRGLFLMVGATGVGKTTTLASLIDYRNSNRTGHILTLEDPIEFVFRNQQSIVNQRQIGSDTKDLHTALKSALRQAPDCILIGEIRDMEAMGAAIAYAQSGHLVLATLHANNAAHALNRILSFYAPENRGALLADLSTTLKAIVSQRLLASTDGGRVPAAEVLINTHHVAELIATGRLSEIPDAIANSLAAGSLSFDRSLTRLLSTEPAQLMRMVGLGPARATTLAVVIELARRVAREQMEQNTLLDNPEAVREYLGLTLRGLEHEAFVALFLNSQHRLITADMMFRGTVNQTAVYPREVLKHALKLNAAAVILSHNHPSGHPEPSDADLSLTRTLQAVLGQVDIRVLDHIIVAGSQQYSFSQHGLL